MFTTIKQEPTSDYNETPDLCTSDVQTKIKEEKELEPNYMFYKIEEIPTENSEQNCDTGCLEDEKHSELPYEDSSMTEETVLPCEDSSISEETVYKTAKQLRQNNLLDYSSYAGQYKQISKKRFICVICTDSPKFTYTHAVIRHLRIEHYGFKFNCPCCTNQYNDRTVFRRHLRKKHEEFDANNIEIDQYLSTEKPKPKPNQEGYSKQLNRFVYAETFRKESDHFICLKCKDSKKFMYKNILYQHIRSTHYNITFICPACDTECKEKHTLKMHLRKLHQIDIESLEMESLIKELPHNDAKQVPAETTFEYADFYKRVNDAYYCIKCTDLDKFISWDAVAHHIRKFHYIIQYQCTECTMEYHHKFQLKSHLMTEHNIIRSTLTRKDYIRIARKTELNKNPRQKQPQQQPSPYAEFIRKVDNYYVCVKCGMNSYKYKSRTGIRDHVKLNKCKGKKRKKEVDSYDESSSEEEDFEENSRIEMNLIKDSIKEEVDSYNENSSEDEDFEKNSTNEMNLVKDCIKQEVDSYNENCTNGNYQIFDIIIKEEPEMVDN